MKYKVELFSRQRHWHITDEDGEEFTAHETYNANSDWTDFEVYDEENNDIEGKKADEIIEAVKNQGE